MKNWEKEVMRRNLLAAVIVPVNGGVVKGNSNPVFGFWQRIFKKPHTH